VSFGKALNGVRLIVTGSSLTWRPKRSLRCFLVEVPWKILKNLYKKVDKTTKITRIRSRLISYFSKVDIKPLSTFSHLYTKVRKGIDIFLQCTTINNLNINEKRFLLYKVKKFHLYSTYLINFVGMASYFSKQ